MKNPMSVFNVVPDDINRSPRLVSPEFVDQLTGTTDKKRRRLEDRGRFPKRVPISDRASGYVLVEVEAWVRGRIAERDDPNATRPSPNPLAKRNREAVAKAGKAKREEDTA